MKNAPNLDDLALFLDVAEAGSLSAAARRNGRSVPTLGRRMTELEAQTGRKLFLRGSGGYALTAEGRSLMEELPAIRGLRQQVERWSLGDQPARVRITSGLSTAHYLAQNIRQIWSEAAIWVPEFMASNRTVDIARRQADIGIRNRRPDQDWLAGRRTRQIEYAEFGADAAVTSYVTLPRESIGTPSERWVWANHADRIVVFASSIRIAIDLARSGVGRVVLPTFVGNREPGLQQLDDPIAEITHDEWLVSHHEARHDPPVRAALDAIGALLAQT